MNGWMPPDQIEAIRAWAQNQNTNEHRFTGGEEHSWQDVIALCEHTVDMQKEHKRYADALHRIRHDACDALNDGFADRKHVDYLWSVANEALCGEVSDAKDERCHDRTQDEMRRMLCVETARHSRALWELYQRSGAGSLVLDEPRVVTAYQVASNRWGNAEALRLFPDRIGE